jgi:hypothetical protein
MTAAEVSQQARPRVWGFSFAAPGPLRSANHRNATWHAAAAGQKKLREIAYGHAAGAGLPKALDRPRVEVLIEFPTNRRRDTANLHATVAKPCVDALGQGRTYSRKVAGRTVQVIERGCGVLVDDDVAHLHCEDCPHLRIGVLPQGRDPRFPHGRITVTITERISE